VKFTGRKPDYKKELGLGYGDYVECYIPDSTGKKTDQPRTEPCIALCPTGNANGSWRFLSLKSKRRVRRSNWQKMVTTDFVINCMNEFAGGGVVVESTADEEDDAADEEHAAEEVDIEGEGAHIDDCVPCELGEEELVTQPEDEPPLMPRKSARIAAGARKPVRFLRSFHTSVKSGLREHGADAYKAIVAELLQLLREKKALEPVHRGDLSVRQLKKVIRSLMFLKTKFDGLGRFEKIKARLVANGKQQDRELYPDTYSPTVGLQAVLMCLTLAAAEGRKVCAIDIGGAYLNADRNSAEGEEVIMELEPMLVGILSKVAPEIKPFTDERGRLLVKLNKAMYGTLDAAKIWYDKLTGVLRAMGFAPNEVDPCVLNRTQQGKQCTIMLYVDDLLVTCQDQSAIMEVIAQLEQAFEGDVKACHDKDLSYLGMHLKIEDGSVTVSMVAYLRGVLDELGVTGKVTTPATADLFTPGVAERMLSEKEAKKFHTVVAKLLYLAKRTRIDILLAIAYLCTRVKAPTVGDQAKLGRVLKYLNGTADQVLVLRPTSELLLEGYVDASFACHPDGKSHTGLVVTLGGCTVLCMSSKQKIVTRDSTEAELVALSDKLMTVVQCYDFLRVQGLRCAVPRLHQDNTSTITLVTKGGGQYRTKYMRVRQCHVKELSDAGDVIISYLPTGRMLADTLTKPLQGAVFRFLTRRITGE
jgi:hypothetical protein